MLDTNHMSVNIALYFKSAYKLGLPVKAVKEIYGFQLKMGKNAYFFRGGLTPFNNGSTNYVTDNKFCVNKLFELAGVPVAKAIGITKKEFEDNNWSAEELKFPLVIKPTVGTSCGKDVLCNIKDIEMLKYHLADKFKKHHCLSVEEFHAGLTSYRVLVFYGKVIGVVKRIPAQIIGDGKHNILELIKIENEKREQFKGTVTFGDLAIDEESKIILAELALTPHDIIQEGKVIKLCYVCNSTRGGIMISLGQQICKENAILLRKAAKVLNLNIVGFDFLCEDINIPVERSRGIIVEANYHPDITIHELPMYGEATRVSEIIMRKFIYKHPFSYVINLLQQQLRRIFLPLNIFNRSRLSIE